MLVSGHKTLSMLARYSIRHREPVRYAPQRVEEYVGTMPAIGTVEPPIVARLIVGAAKIVEVAINQYLTRLPRNALPRTIKIPAHHRPLRGRQRRARLPREEAGRGRSRQWRPDHRAPRDPREGRAADRHGTDGALRARGDPEGRPARTDFSIAGTASSRAPSVQPALSVLASVKSSVCVIGVGQDGRR
jgi:hypothetical protein